MTFHFTYQTKNLVNGKTYIGVHSTTDINDGYVGSGVALKRAIRKYGKINFISQILDYFDSKEEAYEEEKFLVCKKWVKSNDNYNLLVGGICNGRVGKEAWNKNKTGIYSEESLAKMKNSQTGVAPSNRKRVINVKTKKIYDSITHLANSQDTEYKLCYLAEMMRGIKPNKTDFKLLMNL